MVRALNLVSGVQRREGSLGTVAVHAPYDGTPVGVAPVSGPDEAETAIEASLKAFSAWSRSSFHERAAVLTRVADLIYSRAEDLSQLLTKEVGKPITWSRAEVARTELTFRLAAGLHEESEAQPLPLSFDSRGKDYRCTVVRRAVGPVFAIVPYNWPYNLTAHKLAPALAAGCTIVLKPSPLAPLSTLALVALVHEAGCPDGVLNALLTDNQTAESALCDGRMAMVSFTGSPRVGWHIKGLLPDKRVTLELGGDASVLVLEDADLSWAAERCALSAYGYAGQVCISAQHARVHSSRIDEFRERMIAATSKTKSGDPASDDTVCGPLINSDAADRVLEWIDEAESAGARVLAGGNRIGNVVEPTLVEGVPYECRLGSEEVFGPVLTLNSFDDDVEAIAAVNRSAYGIHCSVFTQDEARAESLFEQLDVASVIVNDFPTLRFDNMPYGGVKKSGFGREGVRCAFEEYTNPKVLLRRL